MADVNARDAKLVQYLSEAHSKEKALETALNAHIAMTDRKPYKKRLREHLTETKNHARQLERRIKKIGGATAKGPEIAGQVVAQAKELQRGPLHMLRGTSEEEKLLKNAQTEYSEEHHEIAMYNAIEALAEEVGDKETAKLARSIRRDEEKMARYLENLIPTLTKAVAKAEIPAAERKKSSGRSRSSSSRKSSGSSSRKSSSSARKRSTSGSSRKQSSGGSRKRSSGSSSRSRGGSSSRSRGGSSSRSTRSSRSRS
jgi:ferritin-like metal-binding protein YciE